MTRQNYKMTIAYDGTRYYGWEHQPNTDLTIQGKLENVLGRMVGKSVEVIGAGRTDAGVHARAMVANVFLDTNLTEKEILDYMNRYLPEDICICDIKKAGERFHSRYNALGKTYRYTCYVGAVKPVFDRKYVYVPEGRPDVEKMRMAAEFLVGEHDFASFCSAGSQAETTVRTIYDLAVEKNGEEIVIRVAGSGFLYNMVRIIAGTLMEAGSGRMAPEKMEEILAAKDRTAAGPTAPACGLVLTEISCE